MTIQWPAKLDVQPLDNMVTNQLGNVLLNVQMTQQHTHIIIQKCVLQTVLPILYIMHIVWIEHVLKIVLVDFIKTIILKDAYKHVYITRQLMLLKMVVGENVC